MGMRAVRRAAAQRAHESLLAAERQSVAAALAGKAPDLATAAAAVASQSLARAVPPGMQAGGRDMTIELLGDIDMAPLFRHAPRQRHNSCPGGVQKAASRTADY